VVVVVETGLADMFLSWKAFMPLSKLVFSALLVHANVMYFWVYSQFTLIYLSDINIVRVDLFYRSIENIM
jgi:hypothetical protein